MFEVNTRETSFDIHHQILKNTVHVCLFVDVSTPEHRYLDQGHHQDANYKSKTPKDQGRNSHDLANVRKYILNQLQSGYWHAKDCGKKNLIDVKVSQIASKDNFTKMDQHAQGDLPG